MMFKRRGFNREAKLESRVPCPPTARLCRKLSTAMAEVRRRSERIWWWPLVALPAMAAAIVGLTTFWHPSSIDKVDLLCDQAVHQLLTTTDLVELQRATFLVGWFNCNIRWRLP
jgi:hypothetical protein